MFLWAGNGGLATALVVSAVVLVLRVWLPYQEMKEANRVTLGRIHCTEKPEAIRNSSEQLLCDVTEIVNDDAFEPSDYVLSRDTNVSVYHDEISELSSKRPGHTPD
jgi:hypothetical protein